MGEALLTQGVGPGADLSAKLGLAGGVSAGTFAVLFVATPVTPRRAQKAKVRSMVPIHAKNMHTLIAEKVVLPRGKIDYI